MGWGLSRTRGRTPRPLLREEEVALGCSGLGAVEKIMGGGGQIRFASTFGKCL